MGLVDTSYQPWTGVLHGRLRRIGALVSTNLGLAFEGGVAKVMLLGTYAGAAGFIALLYMNHVFKTVSPFALGNSLYRDFLNGGGNVLAVSPEPLLIMLLTAVVGARLIARDIRSNATAMYFSKAITRFDYFAGKFAVITLFLLSGTFLPVLALWVGQWAMGTEELTWIQRLGDLGSITLHSLVIVIPSSAVILALSSLGKTTYVPATLWIMFWMGTRIVGNILVFNLKESWCSAIPWWNHLKHLGGACYAARELKSRGPRMAPLADLAPVLEYPWWVSAILVGALTLIALAVVQYRLHKLEQRE